MCLLCSHRCCTCRNLLLQVTATVLRTAMTDATAAAARGGATAAATGAGTAAAVGAVAGVAAAQAAAGEVAAAAAAPARAPLQVCRRVRVSSFDYCEICQLYTDLFPVSYSNTVLEIICFLPTL